MKRAFILSLAIVVALAGCKESTNKTGQYLNSINERYGYDGKSKGAEFEERVSKQKLCDELGIEEYGNKPFDTIRELRYAPGIDRCLLSSRSVTVTDDDIDITYRILDVETNLALFYYYYSRVLGKYSCGLTINDEEVSDYIWNQEDDSCMDGLEAEKIRSLLWKGLTE